MIQHPPGGLPPQERQAVRRAGMTALLGVGGVTTLVIALTALGVNENVIFAVVAPIAALVPLYILFGVFRIQRYTAEVRREMRTRPRRQRLKEALVAMLFSGGMVVWLWVQDEVGAAEALSAVLVVCALFLALDICRAPRG